MYTMDQTQPPPAYSEQPVMYAAPPTTVIMTTTSSGSNSCFHASVTGSLILGILNIIIGILCIGLNIPLTAMLSDDDTYDSVLGELGVGYWCGFIFIINGVLGIMAYVKKSRGWAIAFLTVSIIVIPFGFVLFLFSFFNLLFDTYGGIGNTGRDYTEDEIDKYNTSDKLATGLLILGIVEMIIGCISAGFGCGASCQCCHGAGVTRNDQVAYVAGPNVQQPYIQQK